MAQEKDLDLLLVSPNAVPPVAKIVNFSKFLYEENKKKREAKSKSKKSELKEFRFGPSVGEGDINRYAQRTSEFVKEGNRVKICVKMKGREMLFPQVGFDKIKKIEELIKNDAKLEAPAKQMGNMILAIFLPK